VTLTVTSAADTTKSAVATIMLTPGTVEIAPASIDFGKVIKHHSSVQTTTLTNTAKTILGINSITITGSSAFSQTNNCGTGVAAGGSCTITVTFTPGALASFSADVSISDTSTDSPQQVSLSGTGVRFLTNQAALGSALASTRSAIAPSPTGPMPVGTRVLDLIDSSREDPYLNNGAKRELLVRFWYPASLAQGCKLAEYTSPRVWHYFSKLAGVSLPEVRTNSCWNAPIADGVYPIVVFTPGYTATFTDYTFLFEDLASRGYVVASVDHTYEATAVEFPDGRFVESVLGSHLANNLQGDSQTLTLATSVRLGDLEFVVNDLARLNVSTDSPFTSKLDTSRIALAGHSLGGLTAILGVERTQGFRAGIIIDGGVPDGLVIPTESPVLILAAGREQWSENDVHLWNQLRGPRFAVNLKDAEHVTPTDEVWLAKGAISTGEMGPTKTIAAVRDYIAAFLDANLRGQPINSLLTGPSSDYPDAVVTTQEQPLCREPELK
jgi:dienelactone hydrolase